VVDTFEELSFMPFEPFIADTLPPQLLRRAASV
jgi:hypothetical protein